MRLLQNGSLDQLAAHSTSVHPHGGITFSKVCASAVPLLLCYLPTVPATGYLLPVLLRDTSCPSEGLKLKDARLPFNYEVCK